MTQNLVSMTITQEDEDDVDASLDRILARIKFVSLGEENRRRLRMMKAKRAEFGREMIRTMQQYPEMVPRGFDLPGAVADLDALERMERIDARIQQLARCRATRATRLAATSSPPPRSVTRCRKPSAPRSAWANCSRTSSGVSRVRGRRARRRRATQRSNRATHRIRGAFASDIGSRA